MRKYNLRREWWKAYRQYSLDYDDWLFIYLVSQPTNPQFIRVTENGSLATVAWNKYVQENKFWYDECNFDLEQLLKGAL